MAALVGAAMAVVTGNAPASAVNVRYRAADSCTVNGRTFNADIHTWGKPTPANPGVYTEVQQWGYRLDAGTKDVKAVEALRMVWRDGSWQGSIGVGYVNHPIVDGGWHGGPIVGTHMIGYITPTMPTAIMVRVYAGNFPNTTFCRVFLRPYDLYWVG
jgi:hypothetical protein